MRINTQIIREFLTDIINNKIVIGKKYDIRVDIEDGGYNSYIGLNIDISDYGKDKGQLYGVRLFRHTNTTINLFQEWGFELGDVCNSYSENPDILICFSTYGKTIQKATAEAKKYFNRLIKAIEKRTSDYKIKMAADAGDEREKLLARLAELENSEATP